MSGISFAGATRTYPGADRPAVDRLDLEIADGEFLVLVGPSGCGKSTSLRMLAGLEPVDSGTIRIGERDVTRLAPGERDIAMVFQNYALYPHMTAAANMGFALKMAKVPKAEREERIRVAGELLELTDQLGKRPGQLSGGQRQRVAMGRAIVRQPQAFLMDEPLSNLDAKLRVQTRTQIAALQRRLGVTTVYVTHDQVEAMTMGDRVVVLKDGVLQQADTPREMYRRPANVFVAGFLGSPAMNLRACRVHDGHALLGGLPLALPRSAADALAPGDGVTVGFRPESAQVVPADEPDALTVVVDLVEELGADAYAYCSLPEAEDAPTAGAAIVVRVDAHRPPARGGRLGLRVDPHALHLFSTASGERLPG